MTGHSGSYYRTPWLLLQNTPTHITGHPELSCILYRTPWLITEHPDLSYILYRTLWLITELPRMLLHFQNTLTHITEQPLLLLHSSQHTLPFIKGSKQWEQRPVRLKLFPRASQRQLSEGTELLSDRRCYASIDWKCHRLWDGVLKPFLTWRIYQRCVTLKESFLCSFPCSGSQCFRRDRRLALSAWHVDGAVNVAVRV